MSAASLRFTPHPARPQAAPAQPAFNTWHAPDGSVWTAFHRVPEGYLLRFPALVDFLVSADGRCIDAWPVPGASEATVDHLYLNQAVPLALSRQGKLVLHASAVEIDDGAVAFLGVSGRGKSTLAASFATHGQRFLTDDGLLLDWQGATPVAAPSHPSIRLWEDSQAAVMAAGAKAAPAVDYTSKTRFLAGPQVAYCDAPRPLRALYLLGDAPVAAPHVVPVRPAVALMNLVRNSFLLDIEAHAMLAAHFEDISRLANLPIHHQLDFPRRYEALAEVRDAVVRHARGLAP